MVGRNNFQGCMINQNQVTCQYQYLVLQIAEIKFILLLPEGMEKEKFLILPQYSVIIFLCFL